MSGRHTLTEEEHWEYVGGKPKRFKIPEREFVEKFARKWNWKLLKFNKVLTGWINLEYMLRVFLRAYNWRK